MSHYEIRFTFFLPLNIGLTVGSHKDILDWRQRVRAGVVGMMPGGWTTVDDRIAAKIRESGFTGVSCFFDDALDAGEPVLDRLKSVLDTAGLRTAQVNARYESLVDPDKVLRDKGIKSVQKMCGVAHRLDAAYLFVRPGGLSPNGPWCPHPDNRRPETIDRLVQSLKEIVLAAEAESVRLGIEGHVVSPLDSPERVREVIERVDSLALGFNADPVNFFGTLGDVYNSTSLIHRIFDNLDPYIVGAHAKDIEVEDRLVLHIREVPLGDGRLDQETFLRRFEAACPDGFVLIEHLSDELIPKAKASLDAAVLRAGLNWRE